ncbi:MAG: hypothetical protein COB36_01950 [Alphaproteobacteria bacterium]|nr:MAG: hypothetical protein COB36_01950 [Alphaproteobacteria bacterium]
MKHILIRRSRYRYVCSLMLLAFVSVCFSVSSPVFADTDAEDARVNINDIKFEDKQWGRAFLQFLQVGPMILSRDEVFDVAPPPANGSQITKDELIFLKNLEKNKRNEDTRLRIYSENAATSPREFFVKEGLLNAENYNTISLLILIHADQTYFIMERKKHFSRARPSQLDEDLGTVIPNPAHAAYPSGHASQAYIVALVLSEFDPENAEKYKKVAIDVAHRREIAGVHYPSDSVAGRKLAVDILARLRAVPVFEKKFQEAKASYLKPSLIVMTDEEFFKLMNRKIVK